MMAQRKPLPKLHMPPYDLDEVPQADRNLTGSVVLHVDVRERWMASLSELLLLCNESANRRVKKFGIEKRVSDGTQTKPLGLEYIADRLDTDEPLSGYQIRTEAEGWLQGFITMTTFTVWQRNFRWDSHAPENGFTREEMVDRKWDEHNTLAQELDQLSRSGDPDAEGIIWPNVAEVSLLGAIGCGSVLLRMVLETLEAGTQYDYLVVQATDNSVPFYEHFGFIRVGAVARYRDDSAAPSKNPGKRALDEGAELSLPDWIMNKRIRFVVGSDGSRGGAGAGGAAAACSHSHSPSPSSLHRAASHDGLDAAAGGGSASKEGREGGGVAELVKEAERFVMQVQAGWAGARGFRVFSLHRGADGSERCKEWRSAKELGACPLGAQRFLPHRFTASKLPAEGLHEIRVLVRAETIRKKAAAWIEIEDEQAEVQAGYVQLLGSAVAIPEEEPAVDWSDHSEANVARRRALGFVAYCHWTFPEQSVEDIHPSYMMARRLVHGEPPAGGAVRLCADKMREAAPPVKRTHPHTAHAHASSAAPENFDRSHVQAIPTEISEKALKNSMYNKVVTIINNKEEFKYYYVLHYIIDMDWCHLVPMHASGVFSVTSPAVRNGRPRYKLVPEGKGRELDMPAARCRQVAAFTVSKTNDADKEVWDVVEEHEMEEYNMKLLEEKRAQQTKKKEEQAPRPGPGRPGRPPSTLPKKQDDPRPWKVSCFRIMKKMMRHRNAWPFCEPVDYVGLGIPDYPEIVKQPMDLGTVRDRLQQSLFDQPKEWADMMRLVFDNAMLYNPASDRVHEIAKQMRAMFEEELGREGARIKAKEVKRSQKNLIKAAEGEAQIPTPAIPISSQWPEAHGEWRPSTASAAGSVAGTSAAGSGDEMSVGSPDNELGAHHEHEALRHHDEHPDALAHGMDAASYYEASPVLR